MSVKRIRRPLLWVAWLALITAPLVWVKVYYDMGRHDTFAEFRSERWQFLVSDFPRWLGEKWITLLIVAAVCAGLYWISRIWEQRD